MDVRQVFGTNVRRLRLEKGMSQEEFGFAAEIDRTYVSGVERGLRNPSLILAERFAKGLGVELFELLKSRESGDTVSVSSQTSPYFYWDPTSPGWLLRKAEEGEPISRAEVTRVVKANPDLELDPILFQLMLDTISGTLKGKRGAKANPGAASRQYAAIDLYLYYLMRLKEWRSRAIARGWKRSRGEWGLSEAACELVRRRLGYASFEVVRNLISKAKNRKIRVRYNSEDL